MRLSSERRVDAVRLLTVSEDRGSLGASGSLDLEVAVGTTLGQRLVVIWLGLTGVFTLLYAGFLPLSPLSEQLITPVWWIVGAVAIAAAVGVLRRAAWGRLLAVIVVVFFTVWAIGNQVHWVWMDLGDLSVRLADWGWLNPAITVAVGSLSLWWLVRRWPPPRRQAV